MNYYSLNGYSSKVSFREAMMRGQAPDKGLYFPERLPAVEFIDDIDNIADADIAFEVMKPFVAGSLADADLYEIVKETIAFPIELKEINNNLFSLELFHGPTMAFKDVGARFMSRCLSRMMKNEGQTVTVLVATSGDTGGAVAHGFYEVEKVHVVILYPKNRVSPVQEKQLTTLGKNITAFEVEGSFDDCQRMVKQAFADEELRSKKNITSANSINVARWLPQQIYYFLAYKQWKEKDEKPVVCVPSGNFGNICAGLLARLRGLPMAHCIAACNANDVVSDYFLTQKLQPKESVLTLSTAMDVGNPSNFSRVLELYDQQFDQLKKSLSARTVTDAQTLETIKIVYDDYGYTLDPHGAVAYFALEDYLNQHPSAKGFFLETAHPVKFPDAVEKTIGKKMDIPQSLQTMMQQEKKSHLIAADYDALRAFLMS